MGGGAAATSDPRATDVAIDVLRSGGNAVDAALAAALVLYVVEPHYCGLGGDAFLLVDRGDGRPQALDGAGAVPAALTAENLARDGLDTVPVRGVRSATVPGAADLVVTALERFGTWSRGAIARPAIDIARSGFEVRPTLEIAAARTADAIASDPVLGPIYVPGGTPAKVGDTIVNELLAVALEQLVDGGSDRFYRGPTAEAIANMVARDGGYLSVADLADHRTTDVTAEHADFLDATIWQFPAPTQGPSVLRALERLVGSTALEPPIDWAEVLEATHAGMRDAGFDPAAVGAHRRRSGRGDTTYLAVADDSDMVVSLITSVFGEFGSGVGVAELGGPLHNRATTYLMVDRPLAPGKPPHTTIPGMVTRANGDSLAVGVAGGMLQPQVQVQILVHVLAEGAGIQEAIDAPRFKILFGGSPALENGHPLGTEMPDAIERAGQPAGYGAAQVAGRWEGHHVAGADARRNGAAMVFDAAT